MVGRRRAAAQVRPGRAPGRGWRSRCRRRPAPPSPRRSRSPGCASCTATTTSWWSTSRSGVAAHPSPGWTGPTVIGGLAAIGPHDRHQRRGRAAGRGAPARRRHHRADGGGQERAGVQRAQAGVQGARGRQALPRGGAGPPRPAARHHRRADRPAPDPRLQVGGRLRRQAERHPLRHAGGVPGGEPGGRPAGDRPDPPDPGAFRRAAPPLRRRPHVRRGPDAGRPAGPDPAVAARARRWASLHPATRRGRRVRQRVPGRPRARARRLAAA